MVGGHGGIEHEARKGPGIVAFSLAFEEAPQLRDLDPSHEGLAQGGDVAQPLDQVVPAQPRVQERSSPVDEAALGEVHFLVLFREDRKPLVLHPQAHPAEHLLGFEEFQDGARRDFFQAGARHEASPDRA